MNILAKADEIVNQRSEEKEREYGPMNESIERAAVIASEMRGITLTANDVFAVMIAIKLSRISFSDKEDSFLDAVAYMGAWNNYKRQ
jgi:hypothetical protein